MTPFLIQLEWESAPGVTAPELRSTWARLWIDAGEQHITLVEDSASGSVRPAIYVPAYPLAEWVAFNWWHLWNLWRKDAADSRLRLGAAREGFPLPDLRIAPMGGRVRMSWLRSACPGEQVRFLDSGEVFLEREYLQSELRKLVAAVLHRLDDSGISGTPLQDEWELLQSAESDPSQREFCEQAARLNLDPFDIGEAEASAIEQAARILPEEARADFFSSVPADLMTPASELLSDFIRRVQEGSSGGRREAGVPGSLFQGDPAAAPWQRGYADAQALRRHLTLNGGDGLKALEGRLHLELRELQPPAGIDAVAVRTPSGRPLIGQPRRREDSQRFAVCRAIHRYLTAPGDAWLVTRTNAEWQQRSRAFAAEFLAPAHRIRERVHEWVDADDIQALAEEFNVSPYVIEYQIADHNLAHIARS